METLTSATATFETTLRALLPDLQAAEAERLLEVVADLPVEVIKTPETGLIMVQTQDCFDVGFYLGEVLVTTAEVEYCGLRGQATIMGIEPAKAMLAAVVNAVERSPQADALLPLAPLLGQYQQQYHALRDRERLLTAATKVNFESMAEES